ncbi:MAG: transposase, partial [Candidatus Eremiobacteraeota bacterium]|nr:transposase [Candidatus Eremiobacteraeota bacterium]
LQLGLEDEEQDGAERAAAEEVAASAPRQPRGEPANRNRGALPAHLPRYEVVIDIASRLFSLCRMTIEASKVVKGGLLIEQGIRRPE